MLSQVELPFWILFSTSGWRKLWLSLRNSTTSWIYLSKYTVLFIIYMFSLIHDSSVGIALGYGLDDRSSRVRFLAGVGIFLFTTASWTALRPTYHPIRRVPGALSLEVKQLGREADHSPPSSAEVKEWVELYLHSLNTPPWRGSQLKIREIFTFTLSYSSGAINVVP
jgi:hypothetical protein